MTGRIVATSTTSTATMTWPWMRRNQLIRSQFGLIILVAGTLMRQQRQRYRDEEDRSSIVDGLPATPSTMVSARNSSAGWSSFRDRLAVLALSIAKRWLSPSPS